MSGTVNIARALWDDPTFKDSEMSQREAWVWMIAEASWKDRVKMIGSAEIYLARGQLAASTRFLAKAWQWSEPRVRRYFDMLEKRRMITRATDAGVTVITICKYDNYQNGPRAKDAATAHQPTQDRRTADANDKKGEIKEDIPEANASGRDASQPDVEIDLSKDLFDRGVAYLGRHGIGERQARTFIGKCRKDHADGEIMAAFMACSDAKVVDPIPWITARLKPRGSPHAVPLDQAFAAAMAQIQAEDERKAARK